jgi:hypothetical protein
MDLKHDVSGVFLEAVAAFEAGTDFALLVPIRDQVDGVSGVVQHLDAHAKLGCRLGRNRILSLAARKKETH